MASGMDSEAVEQAQGQIAEIQEQAKGLMGMFQAIIPKRKTEWLLFPLKLASTILWASNNLPWVGAIMKVVPLDKLANFVMDKISGLVTVNINNLIEFGLANANDPRLTDVLTNIKLDQPTVRKVLSVFGAAGSVDDIGEGVCSSVEQRLQGVTGAIAQASPDEARKLHQNVMGWVRGIFCSDATPLVVLGLSAVNLFEPQIRKHAPQLGQVLDIARPVLNAIPGSEKQEMKELATYGLPANEVTRVFTQYFATAQKEPATTSHLLAEIKKSSRYGVAELYKIGAIAKNIEEADYEVKAADMSFAAPAQRQLLKMASQLSEMATYCFEGLANFEQSMAAKDNKQKAQLLIKGLISQSTLIGNEFGTEAFLASAEIVLASQLPNEIKKAYYDKLPEIQKNIESAQQTKLARTQQPEGADYDGADVGGVEEGGAGVPNSPRTARQTPKPQRVDLMAIMRNAASGPDALERMRTQYADVNDVSVVLNTIVNVVNLGKNSGYGNSKDAIMQFLSNNANNLRVSGVTNEEAVSLFMMAVSSGFLCAGNADNLAAAFTRAANIVNPNAGGFSNRQQSSNSADSLAGEIIDALGVGKIVAPQQSSPQQSTNPDLSAALPFSRDGSPSLN